MTGKKSDKYLDPKLGAKGGYKSYKIEAIDMKSNRVYLEELTVGSVLLLAFQC